MEKKLKNRICHQWAKILILGLVFNAPLVLAEKSKKPQLPKSYESKAAPAEITDTDRMFIDLREAARKNDVFRTQQLSSNLANYPFDDYVAYFRIKPQLFDSAGGVRNDYSADAQVVTFLNQYQGTALADRMRNDWLLVLGKRKDWARFDAEYAALRDLIASKSKGELLGLHCKHRNPDVPPTFFSEMLIFDSLVHEMDIVRYLTDSPIKSVEIKFFKQNSNSPEGVHEPILALFETQSGVLANVEMNVSVRFGYQVKTEAVFENAIAEIGNTGGMRVAFEAELATAEHVSYTTRFAAAYDNEIQRWVNAVHRGTIDGPSTWDGYLAACVVEAGLEAFKTGNKVAVQYAATPTMYGLAS